MNDTNENEHLYEADLELEQVDEPTVSGEVDNYFLDLYALRGTIIEDYLAPFVDCSITLQSLSGSILSELLIAVSEQSYLTELEILIYANRGTDAGYELLIVDQVAERLLAKVRNMRLLLVPENLMLDICTWFAKVVAKATLKGYSITDLLYVVDPFVI